MADKKKGYFTLKGIKDSSPMKMKRRLLELGFTIGQRVNLVRKSLLGRAYLVEIRGFTLSMRRDVLECLILE